RSPHRPRHPGTDQHQRAGARRVSRRRVQRQRVMPPLLHVDGVSAGYGKIEVLHDLTIAVPEGAVVALLGPNGAGKTTTLRAISGTIPVKGGAIRFGGRRLHGRSAYEIARQGVVL